MYLPAIMGKIGAFIANLNRKNNPDLLSATFLAKLGLCFRPNPDFLCSCIYTYQALFSFLSESGLHFCCAGTIFLNEFL